MKLIAFPLACLVVISLLSLTGLGSGTLGTAFIGGDPQNAVYYDINGREVVYVSNLTAVTPTESIRFAYLYVYGTGNIAQFTNGTLLGIYTLYYDDSGDETMVVMYEDLGKTYQGFGFDAIELNSSLGLLALIVGLMALALIVGIRVLGSGVSEESVSAALKGTAFLSLWGIFSALSLDLIVSSGDLFLPMIYFVLTIIYTLGIINQIGHPGDD